MPRRQSAQLKQISQGTYVFLNYNKNMQRFFQCVMTISDYNVFVKRGKKQLAFIALHDLWAVNASHLRYLQHLSTQYYIAVPDLYQETQIINIEDAIKSLKKIKVKKIVELINEIIETLSIEEEVEKFMLVGIGMGGALALKLIQQEIKDIKASIIYYGIPKLSQINFDKIQIPIQIHHPKNSQVEGLSDLRMVEKLKGMIPNNKKKLFYFQEYDAGHGFIDSEDEEFDEAERKSSLKRSKMFVKEHIQDKCLLF